MTNPRELLDALEANGRPLNVGQLSAELIDLITDEGHPCVAVTLDETAVLTFEKTNPNDTSGWAAEISNLLWLLRGDEIVKFTGSRQFLEIEFKRST